MDSLLCELGGIDTGRGVAWKSRVKCFDGTSISVVSHWDCKFDGAGVEYSMRSVAGFIAIEPREPRCDAPLGSTVSPRKFPL